MCWFETGPSQDSPTPAAIASSSQAKVDFPGNPLEVAVQTRCPWDGAVHITFEQASGKPFGLHLRIPGWCRSFAIKVNGEAVPAGIQARYAVITRPWQAGDQVDIFLDMPVERVVSHPFVGDREGVAIQRGPVVYCLEGEDNPGMDDAILAREAHLAAEYRPDLLGGVVTITGQSAGGGTLTAIPYFAWDNRRTADKALDWLLVWLRQEDWFQLRQPLDGEEMTGWKHRLYRA